MSLLCRISKNLADFKRFLGLSMDSNKEEEACRLKALAEDKMKSGDFVEAQKLLLKAQSLFSGLESLPQMLAVCDVHCSADKKINGLENWYGILQVMHFADDATIKKQVRKLSLLLHPDKNQFASSEAAFKLVWEANRLLADKDKRSQYDIRRRIYLRFARNQSNGNSGVQCAAVNNVSDSCRRPYMAFNTGFNGAPPKSSPGQKEVRNQGPCNTSVNTNVESTGAQPGSVAADVEKKGTFNKKNGRGSKKTEVKKPKIEAETSKPKQNEAKMKSAANLHKRQPEVTEPEIGASKSVLDEPVSRSGEAPSMSKDKKKRKKCVEEPIESINVDGSGTVEDKADSKDNNKRKSPRIRKQSSYTVEVGNDGSLSPPKKRSRSNVGLKSKQTIRKESLGVGSSKRLDSGGSSAPSCVFKAKAKKNVDSGYQETPSTKEKESEGCEASGERLVMAGKIDNNHNANEKLVSQDLPDPEFNNFELKTSCFAVNQVWSMYDPTDGMPRLYARIEKVLDSEFKLWITWIDPVQDIKDDSIPVACGIFQDGNSDEENDHLKFSCQMLHSTRNNNIVIYPRKGEIWAIFRGWDISWSASSEYHKRPYEYDYVEILSNFKDEYGLGVAYLGKLEGFVSLFRQDAQDGVLQLQIPPSEMLRFSHKVPSFKMTGKEREGVPPGCFELDTAALPKDMFEVDVVELDKERPNVKNGGRFAKVLKVEGQASTTLETSPPPKKRQKIDDNHGLYCGQPAECCTSGEKRITPKKSEKINTTDSSRIRKIPVDIHRSTGYSKKFGRNDESLSQSRGNGFLTRLNGVVKCSEPKTHKPSSCKIVKENTFNFEYQRSWDKFQIDQVWAIYSSNDKGIPRKYVQIKEIDIIPEFKLHVAPLELYRPPELITRPICCGRFKLKTGKAEVLVPINFSHQVKAVKGKKNRFEVYPGKGEVWALYKNSNTADCSETEQLEIVEVVETDEKRIQAMPLIPKGLNNKLHYKRSQESNAGFVDIPKTDVSSFSHQIPAFRHERRTTRFGDGEYWELDLKAVQDINLKSS